MWTRKQNIQGVLLAIPLLALEFYRVPTPLSWYDCANSIRGCYVPDHFWGILGFTLLIMPALGIYAEFRHQLRKRS